jgi:hypothetical protein
MLLPFWRPGLQPRAASAGDRLSGSTSKIWVIDASSQATAHVLAGGGRLLTAAGSVLHTNPIEHADVDQVQQQPAPGPIQAKPAQALASVGRGRAPVTARALDYRRLAALHPDTALALQRSVGNRNLCQLIEGQRAARAAGPAAAVPAGTLRSEIRLARRVPIPEDLSPDERQRAEDYLAEAEQRRRHPDPPPAVGSASFNGSQITVSKNGQTESCQALTSSSAPTPKGRFCVRRQGEAQRWGGFYGTVGRFGGVWASTAVRQDRSRWYLLEPQFTTTRSKMQLHFGTHSDGCITVTNADCFQRLENVLNQDGTSSAMGYDGYPPGNADGVSNAQHAVDCVAMLDVT